jgi:hypothetical protein
MCTWLSLEIPGVPKDSIAGELTGTRICGSYTYFSELGLAFRRGGMLGDADFKCRTVYTYKWRWRTGPDHWGPS